jgi:hypothetical protein
MTPKTLFACSLAISALVLAPAVTHALPFVGQPSPVAGYAADDGTELWMPDDIVLSLEVYDVIGDNQGWESSFGFYWASDPTTLVTVFGPDDQFAPGDTSGQQAQIDFVRGIVIDADQLVLESLIPAGAGPIGFFAHLRSASTDLTLYSQAALNTAIAGEDAFASWRSDTIPGQYLLGVEFGQQQLALRVDLVRNVSPIPEPKAALVFLFGLLVVGIALRWRAPLPGC